jgi:hypothetical protein
LSLTRTSKAGPFTGRPVFSPRFFPFRLGFWAVRLRGRWLTPRQESLYPKTCSQRNVRHFFKGYRYLDLLVLAPCRHAPCKSVWVTNQEMPTATMRAPELKIRVDLRRERLKRITISFHSGRHLRNHPPSAARPSAVLRVAHLALPTAIDSRWHHEILVRAPSLGVAH